MTDRKASIQFMINGLPYKAEPLILMPGETAVRVDEALKRFDNVSAPFSEEDMSNIWKHQTQIPTELWGQLLMTHLANVNGPGYYLSFRVGQDGNVGMDWRERHRQCSPDAIRVLLRCP